MPETAFLITAFATLFVVIDPPGLVPMFIALTRGMGPDLSLIHISEPTRPY